MRDGWQVTVCRQGNEAEPVVVIDNFAPLPQRFIDDASFLKLEPMGEHYPGLRAAVPPSLLLPLLADLAPLIEDVFGLAQCRIADALYSLVTTTPDDLKPIQRLPHFDGVEPERLALLHYLSRDARGGTAFYRHRSTGFETVTAARLGDYRRALDADLQREGVPPPGYIGSDTAIYTQVARHAGHFNRAILYRGNTLHCADLPADLPLTADPATGRFTVNTFLTG